jgi:hypothetical protein
MESSASRRRGNAVAGGRLCSIASIAAWLLLLYSLGTLVQLMVLGGQPATAAEAFDLLQRNRVIGLLRLDVPTVFALPLYYLLFLGLHATLGRVDPAQATGVTLVLASPMGLSMLPLSEKYAAASSEEARRLVLAAGEAILATDMWHSTSAYVGGVLLQTGAVLMSVVMVRTAVFSKATGWVGVLSHGLDLIHVALAPFAPRTAAVLMMVAGPLYLIWFPRVARELRHVASAEDGPADSLEPRGTRGGGGRHAT